MERRGNSGFATPERRAKGKQRAARRWTTGKDARRGRADGLQGQGRPCVRWGLHEHAYGEGESCLEGSE